MWQGTSLLYSDLFVWWQVVQCSVLLFFIGSQDPHILFQCIAVNIVFLHTMSKEDAVNISLQFTDMSHLTNTWFIAWWSLELKGAKIMSQRSLRYIYMKVGMIMQLEASPPLNLGFRDTSNLIIAAVHTSKLGTTFVSFNIGFWSFVY